MNILLIGPRGSGKSTLGRGLALRDERSFLDLDEVVLAGFELATVSQVWNTEGQGAWRRAETEALELALGQDEQVIALGGGVPMIEEARRAIEAAQNSGGARVVYLNCSIPELSRRLSKDPGDRPSLTGAEMVSEIRDVLQEREPVYRALADLILEVTSLSPKEAIKAIASGLNALEGS